jgi:membrane protease YdiL (CAAX protease family)
MIFSDFDIANRDLSNYSYVNYLKAIQLLSGLGLFIIPILLYSYVTNFNLNFRNQINRQNFLLVLAIMFLIPPFVSLLLEWNMQIPVPDFLIFLNNDSEPIVRAFLRMNSLFDLAYNLFIIAIIPAIGEELFFRGYLQKQLSNLFNNIHLSILLTAFLFSAVHLHFHGLLPRFVLGVLLGYLLFWSQNLWIPIIAHFVNNALAVILSYKAINIETGSYAFFRKKKLILCLQHFHLLQFPYYYICFIKTQKKKTEKSLLSKM